MHYLVVDSGMVIPAQSNAQRKGKVGKCKHKNLKAEPQRLAKNFFRQWWSKQEEQRNGAHEEELGRAIGYMVKTNVYSGNDVYKGDDDVDVFFSFIPHSLPLSPMIHSPLRI